MIHRTQQGAPDREGWFYGRMRGNPPDKICATEIARNRYGFLRAVVDGEMVPLADFAWFGEVPTCREG